MAVTGKLNHAVALEVKDLHKRFGALEVLRGVSLTARQGDVISVIGSSGSGKSTLLRCINFLEVPDAGEVLLQGELILTKKRRNGILAPADRKQIDRLRSRLGMVFQSFNLWNHMTVLENVVEAPIFVQRRPKKEVIDFAGPYAKTPGSFATLKSSPLAKFKSSPDRVTLNEISADEQSAIDQLHKLLKGKIIGVQTTTTHSNFLDTYFKKIATIRKYDSQENVLLDLTAGRIDAAEGSLSYWVPIMKKDQGKDLALFGPTWTGDIFGLGNGIGVRKEDPELKAIFNKALKSLREDGTLQKLALKWFGFDNSPK